LAGTLSTAQFTAVRPSVSIVEFVLGLFVGTLFVFPFVIFELAACLWLPIRWKAGKESCAWEVAGLITVPVVLCTIVAIPVAFASPINAGLEQANASWFGYSQLTLIIIGGLWGLGLLKVAIDTLSPGRSEATLATVLVVGAVTNLLIQFAAAAFGVFSAIFPRSAAA
jgi:hypothetical protein